MMKQQAIRATGRILEYVMAAVLALCVVATGFWNYGLCKKRSRVRPFSHDYDQIERRVLIISETDAYDI
jgi:hypothetical protein